VRWVSFRKLSIIQDAMLWMEMRPTRRAALRQGLEDQRRIERVSAEPPTPRGYRPRHAELAASRITSTGKCFPHPSAAHAARSSPREVARHVATAIWSR